MDTGEPQRPALAMDSDEPTAARRAGRGPRSLGSEQPRAASGPSAKSPKGHSLINALRSSPLRDLALASALHFFIFPCWVMGMAVARFTITTEQPEASAHCPSSQVGSSLPTSDRSLGVGLAEFEQSLDECSPEICALRGGWRDVSQNADAVDLPRLLPPGGERRGEETASNGRDEGSPVHHSIT